MLIVIAASESSLKGPAYGCLTGVPLRANRVCGLQKLRWRCCGKSQGRHDFHSRRPQSTFQLPLEQNQAAARIDEMINAITRSPDKTQIMRISPAPVRF